jgi:hypothetical protein
MPRRPKQEQIPGTEPPSIAEIDEAAEALLDIRERRRDLLEQQREAKAELVAAMKRHGQRAYRDAGARVLVTLETQDRVVVKFEKEDDEEDED